MARENYVREKTSNDPTIKTIPLLHEFSYLNDFGNNLSPELFSIHLRHDNSSSLQANPCIPSLKPAITFSSVCTQGRHILSPSKG